MSDFKAHCDCCSAPSITDDALPRHANPCGHIYCQDCLQKVHDKNASVCTVGDCGTTIEQDDNVHPIAFAVIRSDHKELERPRECPEHDSENTDYCNDCDKFLCVECVKTHEKEHTINKKDEIIPFLNEMIQMVVEMNKINVKKVKDEYDPEDDQGKVVYGLAKTIESGFRQVGIRMDTDEVKIDTAQDPFHFVAVVHEVSAAGELLGKIVQTEVEDLEEDYGGEENEEAEADE